MRTIRASELGSFLYCQRAWAYQQRGAASENTSALSAGISRHQAHAATVKSALLLKWFSVLLLLIGVVIILAEIL